MKRSSYPFKQLLSGGLLCCLILLAAYVFQAFFSGMYIDAFSSSIYLLTWLVFFVGALLWTFRAKGERFGISEIIDWQFIAAFILMTADQIYKIMPREIYMEIAPALSEYTIPVLVIVGMAITVAIKIAITQSRNLMAERRLTTLQSQQIQRLLDSPPAEQTRILLFRELIENRSIAQFSAKDYLLLIEECRTIDPKFFAWLKKQGYQLSPREIVFCVLIRMYKTKQEIVSILCIADGAYRTIKSRTRKHLGIEGDKELEVFLQKELQQ